MFLLVIYLYHQRGFAQEAIVLVGSGSSVPAPLYNRWAQEYNKRDKRIQMKYLPIGTSEGIREIFHGNGDFGAGEAQLTAADRKEGDLVELPAVLIGIVPIYNLHGVNTQLRFSGGLLAEIFLGQVQTWNDSRIAKINPGISLPSLPIKVIYRPAGKGSNYIWRDSERSHRRAGDLGLARAYPSTGDNGKARAAYQDFLALWQNADPDIPILKEAKAEYAKLQ